METGQPIQKSRAPLAGANALLAFSGFHLEFLPPYSYHPSMTDTSSTDSLVESGMDPKIAEAIKNFVETEIESSVETAVRSFEIADEARQREAADFLH